MFGGVALAAEIRLIIVLLDLLEVSGFKVPALVLAFNVPPGIQRALLSFATFYFNSFFQRLLLSQALFHRIFPHVFRDFHGTEVRGAR